jgi:hypothetical protein
MKKYIAGVKVVILATILAAGVSYIGAWTGPTSTPPNGNVAAPLNASSVAQTKNGPLVINFDNLLNPGLEILGPIQIVDGTQATGSVLVSNGVGVSKWAATSTLGISGGTSSGKTVQIGTFTKAQGTNSGRVTFPTAFSSTPQVVASFSGLTYTGGCGTNWFYYVLTVGSTTPTGFNWTTTDNNDGCNQANTIQVSWTAVGN